MDWIYDDLSDDEPLRYKILKYHKNWLSLYHNFNKQSSKDFENRISGMLQFLVLWKAEHQSIILNMSL